MRDCNNKYYILVFASESKKIDVTKKVLDNRVRFDVVLRGDKNTYFDVF